MEAVHEHLASEEGNFDVPHLRGKLHVGKDVFNPTMTLASPLLAASIDTQSDEDILDMFTGTGYVGLVAAQNGARVVACDLNPKAVECARNNATTLNLDSKFISIQSDLFDALGSAQFDLISANPPLFPGQLKSRTTC